ncbi:hypothetical protein U5B43_03660 [Campylobacter sp. 9BO]|uniref:hypothetical protein n=1 Tax=Campylobacter sp. 9BO TaxID=3424759 RepID=UPI003D326895
MLKATEKISVTADDWQSFYEEYDVNIIHAQPIFVIESNVESTTGNGNDTYNISKWRSLRRDITGWIKYKIMNGF